MKKTLAIFAGVTSLALLAGCNPQTADQKTREALAWGCPQGQAAIDVIQAVNAGNILSPRTVAGVSQAKAALDAICANRDTATALTVIAKASIIATRLKAALEEANRKGADVGYAAGNIRRLEQALAKAKL